MEFWSDVFLAIRDACPKDISYVRFHLAYTLYDSDDSIDCETHAQKTLGDRRHSVEQRVGAEFIRRKIYPGKDYFDTERKGR